MFKKIMLISLISLSGAAIAGDKQEKVSSSKRDCCEKVTTFVAMPFLWALEAFLWATGPKQCKY